MSDRPRTYNVLNILMKFHAFPSETQGKFCMVECPGPVGAGAPPNSPMRSGAAAINASRGSTNDAVSAGISIPSGDTGVAPAGSIPARAGRASRATSSSVMNRFTGAREVTD